MARVKTGKQAQQELIRYGNVACSMKGRGKKKNNNKPTCAVRENNINKPEVSSYQGRLTMCGSRDYGRPGETRTKFTFDEIERYIQGRYIY